MSQKKKPKRRRRAGPALLVLLAVALFAAAAVSVSRYLDEQKQYQAMLEEKRAVMEEAISRNVIFDGVVVDGVPLGGLTMDQARQKLRSREQAIVSRVAMEAVYQTESFPITSQDIGYSFNTEEVLKEAWAVGRTGTDEARYAEILRVAEEGRTFDISYTYDKELLRGVAMRIAAQLDHAPVEASVDGFDPSKQIFNYTDGEPGLEVDQDRLFADLTAAVDAENVTASVQVHASPVQPSNSGESLRGKFGLIGSYTTNTTSDSARNNNITLCSNALNMQMIQPSATFSINTTTGPRTEEKGYREAGAYRGGRLVPEFGGGVCQVSSTFFNAAIRGGIDVVERHSHSMTVSYVEIGQDAAIDFATGKDVKILNTTNYPMWVITSFANKTLTVSFYGYIILEPGTTVDMRTEILQTIEPGETKYIVDTSLAPGEELVFTSAKTGYKTRTFLQTLKEGKVVSEVQLHTSDYRAATKEVHTGPSTPVQNVQR